MDEHGPFSPYLVFSRQIAPEIFRMSLPVVILLIITTVYIKAHYVVDMFAAVLVLPLMLMTTEFLSWLIPGKLEEHQ